MASTFRWKSSARRKLPPDQPPPKLRRSAGALRAKAEGEIVTLLLDRGAMIDEIVPEDENPLIQASAEGRLEVVKLLIARGANVNARAWSASSPRGAGGEWRTPLSVARRGGHDAVTRYLQSKGASE